MKTHIAPALPQAAATSVLKRSLCGAALASSLALGACSGLSNPFDMAALGDKPAAKSDMVTGSMPKTDLQKATEYWGKAFEKNPGDPQTAVNYVRNLKAMDAKPQALQVIQQAYTANPNNKRVASEYGRLALEQDQLSLADKLLAQADDPITPDWKTISARGTVLAKQNKYREAIVQFERARMLVPNQSSVLNNLALAYAMDGHAEMAEPLLRQAATDEHADAKVSQNLSLVLGLEGKTGEAKAVMVKNAPDDDVTDDANLVRDMVGTQPNAAAIKTSSMLATKPRIAGKARAAAAATQDPSVLVQRLADGYAVTPSDTPVQLLPAH